METTIGSRVSTHVPMSLVLLAYPDCVERYAEAAGYQWCGVGFRIQAWAVFALH